MDFIHKFIPVPDDQARRVLLLLHGTGGNEDDLIPLGRDLDPKAALLSLRGNVLENGMPRFFRRLAEGLFDEEDVIRRAHELADFMAAAADRYAFDQTRVTAVGYSNGANIAAAILLLRSDALASAVLFAPWFRWCFSTLPNLADAHVLLSSGAADPIVPVENAGRLAAMLREAGADVTSRFEPAGHAFVAGDIEAARKWLVNR